MEALNALFDGLRTELKPIHDFYLKTYSFTDPRQSGGQREWNAFIDALALPEWETNRVLRGVRNIYRNRVQSLLHPDLDKTVCPYGESERKNILQERQKILADCMDCLESVRSIITDLSNVPDSTYQENKPVSIVEFSDEHIPVLKLMEAMDYEDAITGTEFASYFKKMKDRGRIYKRHNRETPLHFRVAVNPVREKMIHGYLFCDSTMKDGCDTHTYETARGNYESVRRTTKVMTMGVRPEIAGRAVPELVCDALDHMARMQSDRLECRIDEYHPEA